MTVLEILLAQLEKIGADGLCNSEEQCGCGTDDLAPCGAFQRDCEAAQLHAATEPGESHDVGDRVYFPMNLTAKESES